MTNVQIPEILLLELYLYFSSGNGMDDKSDAANTIRRAITDKYNSHLRRVMYTVYKTSNDPDAAERARQRYLDEIGVPDEFRW